MKQGYGGAGAGGGSTVTSPSLLFWPASVMQWAFVLLLLVQAAGVLALEGWALASFEGGLTPQASNPMSPPPDDMPHVDQNGNRIHFPPGYAPFTRSLPTFFALYIFGLVYELGLAWDALRLKNTIQIIGIGIFNVALLVYGAIQQVQIQDITGVIEPVLTLEARNSKLEDHLQKVVIAVPVIVAVFSVALLYVGWKLYNEFAWTIYKHVSADLQIRRRYMIFEIYIALLKFDFFFFLGFTMEFLVLLATNTFDYELYLTIAAVPVTIAVLIAAGAIVRKENKPLMVLVLLFYLLGLAYFIFKLARIWTPNDNQTIYSPAEKPLTVLAVVTIILIIVTFGVAVKCMLNFDKGLKPFVSSRKVTAHEEEDRMYMNDLPNPKHPSTAATMPDRMVIE